MIWSLRWRYHVCSGLRIITVAAIISIDFSISCGLVRVSQAAPVSPCHWYPLSILRYCCEDNSDPCCRVVTLSYIVWPQIIVLLDIQWIQCKLSISIYFRCYAKPKLFYSAYGKFFSFLWTSSMCLWIYFLYLVLKPQNLHGNLMSLCFTWCWIKDDNHATPPHPRLNMIRREGHC